MLEVWAKFFALGKYSNLDRFCPLQISHLQSSCTGSCIFPIAANISGPPSSDAVQHYLKWSFNLHNVFEILFFWLHFQLMACYDHRKEVCFMGLILQVLVSGCNLGEEAKELHQTAPCLILKLKCVRMYSVVYLECYKHTPFILMNDLLFVCFHQSYLMMGNVSVQNPQPKLCHLWNVKTIQRFISIYGITKAFLSFF